MLKKHLISLDFDGTLFDSARRIATFPELQNIWGEKFNSAFQEFRKQGEFLPHLFATYLYQQGLLASDSTQNLIKHFNQLQRDAAAFVYKDAKEFVGAFPKDMLIILSRAHPEWQIPTIRNSGLYDRVSQVLVVTGDQGKAEVLQKLSLDYSPIFHIDDSPRELEHIQKVPEVKKIFIKRSGNESHIKGDCSNLIQAIAIIQNNLSIV